MEALQQMTLLSSLPYLGNRDEKKSVESAAIEKQMSLKMFVRLFYRASYIFTGMRSKRVFHISLSLNTRFPV